MLYCFLDRFLDPSGCRQSLNMENWLVLLIGRLLLLGAIIRIHVIFKDLHDVLYDRCFNFLIPNSNPTQVYREVIFQARGQF